MNDMNNMIVKCIQGYIQQNLNCLPKLYWSCYIAFSEAFVISMKSNKVTLYVIYENKYLPNDFIFNY